jgi:hypothetical protein
MSALHTKKEVNSDVVANFVSVHPFKSLAQDLEGIFFEEN